VNLTGPRYAMYTLRLCQIAAEPLFSDYYFPSQVLVVEEGTSEAQTGPIEDIGLHSISRREVVAYDGSNILPGPISGI
jgi:hypothetical protein